MTSTLLDERRSDVTELAQALRALWQQALQRCQTPDEPLNRALTMNFIAVCDRAREAELDRLVQRLLVRHPCRAFVVSLDDAHADLTASVTADVRRQGNGCDMVLERIKLHTTLRQIPKLPGLIRPLLVNDIPVHFFWGTAIPEDEGTLLLLGELAHQTTLDSSSFADPQVDLVRVLRLPELRIVDLAHFRLTPWRKALAEAFETFEWQRRPATVVRLLRGTAPGAVAATASLARWLEQKLAAEVTVAVTAEEAPLHEPLQLHLQHDGVQVTVRHRVVEPLLHVQTTLQDACMLPFLRPASRASQGDLLAAALDE